MLPVRPVARIREVASGVEADRLHPAFLIWLCEDDAGFPSVQILPELFILHRKTRASGFHRETQPLGSLMFSLGDRTHPKGERFPVDVLFPRFEEHRPWELLRLLLSVAPGFRFNPPLHQADRLSFLACAHGSFKSRVETMQNGTDQGYFSSCSGWSCR